MGPGDLGRESRLAGRRPADDEGQAAAVDAGLEGTVHGLSLRGRQRGPGLGRLRPCRHPHRAIDRRKLGAEMTCGGVDPCVAILRCRSAGQCDEVRVADRLVEQPKERLGVGDRRGERGRELLGADHPVPSDERVDRVLRRGGEIVPAARDPLQDRITLRAIRGQEARDAEGDRLQVRVAREARKRPAILAPSRALPVLAIRRRVLRHPDRRPSALGFRNRRRRDP